MGHLRANGGGSSDDTNDPPEWLEDLLIQVDQIGAPVRHYHLQAGQGSPSSLSRLPLVGLGAPVVPASRHCRASGLRLVAVFDFVLDLNLAQSQGIITGPRPHGLGWVSAGSFD